jgi:hypothetical protein
MPDKSKKPDKSNKTKKPDMSDKTKTPNKPNKKPVKKSDMSKKPVKTPDLIEYDRFPLMKQPTFIRKDIYTGADIPIFI